jgi:hypothetical protein
MGNRKGFAETLKSTVNSVIEKLPKSVLFAAQKIALTEFTIKMKTDLRNDALAAQITSPQDLIQSIIGSMATFVISKLLADTKFVKTVGETFCDVPEGVSTLAADIVINAGVGVGTDLAMGKINSPQDIALSVIGSVGATALTTLVDSVLKKFQKQNADPAQQTWQSLRDPFAVPLTAASIVQVDGSQTTNPQQIKCPVKKQ